MRKFVIVNDPHYTVANPKYYNHQAAAIMRQLREDDRLTKEDEVTVVTNVEEAVRECQGAKATIVFLSSSAAGKAHEIAERHGKSVRIFCFTGLIPRNEVIWQDKTEGDGVDSFTERLIDIR